MTGATPREIEEVIGLEVHEASVHEAGGALYFLAGRGAAKRVGCVGEGLGEGQAAGRIGGRGVLVGPMSHRNAEEIRRALPWTSPKPLGLAASVGFGDRLGLATPGHVRAVRGSGLAPVFAQQSIRELARTARTPQQVIDCATWGVLQEGFAEGFGADADHLQRTEDIDATAPEGFTMFTIDPGAHVDDTADESDANALAEKFNALDFNALATTPGELRATYTAKAFGLAGGGTVTFDEQTFLRAAVKYGGAVAHTLSMYRRLREAAIGDFEVEVSVDETESPTSAAEHYFFAAELRRLGVEWVSMAPRFVGRFEKGVDYIGGLEAFRASFAEHVAVMRTLGPYKLSIHSGSDKFSIYPIVADLAEGMVHLKTAGTSYLEAVRTIARVDPPLFREILDFARRRYETDKATYHVSADVSKVPEAREVPDEDLAGLIDRFDTRQALHVTFGSVLTAGGNDDFSRRIYAALQRDEELHYTALKRHLGRHVAPFARR